MAYSRYRRKPRRSYAKSARKPRSARPSRSIGKTRRYTRKRPMSKKRILNITSRKKRDTMLSWSNTSPTGTVQAFAVGGANIRGNTYGTFLWCATARDLSNGSGANTISLQSQRTAQTCFMRGLSEKLRLQTSSGVPWFHRRICFTSKDAVFTDKADDDTGSLVNSTTPYLQTSNGYARLWRNDQINNAPNTINERQSVIFKGSNGQDWNDVLIAPLDTARITVKYDRTSLIRSGNASGTVQLRNMWHPMNKNLVYDDDEAGDRMIAQQYSVESKAGMGDYYVYDIFVPGVGATATDILNVGAVSSLYWHEK